MGNIYEELGLKGMINAGGTYTMIGGSRMSEQTLQAMHDAASQYIFIKDLQKAAHEKLAQLTKNEAAFISNGADTGIYLSIAAAIQLKRGKNFNYLTPEEIRGTDIVMFRAHRNPYDQVIKHLGASYRELGYPNTILMPTEADLEEAISENTAAVFYVMAGWLPEGAMDFEKTVEIAHRKGVPVIVDAAAQLPYVENLWKITERGADIVIFSGGKDLRGPQASGLVLGKKYIMDAVYELGFFNYGIGRMMKVGREEIAGLYSAVKQYVEMDHDKRNADAEADVLRAIDDLNKYEYFSAERSYPNEAGQPMARVLVKLNKGVKASEIMDYMLKGEPSIYVNSDWEDSFWINPMCLEPGEMDLVLDKLHRFTK